MNTAQPAADKAATKAATKEIEVHVCLDADGNWTVGECLDDLADRWAERVGDDSEPSTARRVVKVLLTVPLPRPVVLTGVVPEEPAGDATLSVE